MTFYPFFLAPAFCRRSFLTSHLILAVSYKAKKQEQTRICSCMEKSQKKMSVDNLSPLSTLILVGEGGFEPPKSLTTDLQSAPFGHSGTLPYLWSWWTDSNPRPADYKSAALPTELHQHFFVLRYNTISHRVCQLFFAIFS